MKNDSQKDIVKIKPFLDIEQISATSHEIMILNLLAGITGGNADPTESDIKQYI